MLQFVKIKPQIGLTKAILRKCVYHYAAVQNRLLFNFVGIDYIRVILKVNETF